MKDTNDHCPSLITKKEKVCADEKTVYLTAFDEDVKPNGAPLSFKIVPEGTRGEWDLEIINGKYTSRLKRAEELFVDFGSIFGILEVNCIRP